MIRFMKSNMAFMVFVLLFILTNSSHSLAVSKLIKEAKVEHIKMLKWLGKAAEPYKGLTIRMITETTPPSIWINKIKNEFTKYTGIKVIIERESFPFLEEKALADFSKKKGIYDVFNGDYSWTGKYVMAGYVIPLNDLLNNKKLTYSNYNSNDFYSGFWKGTSWKGTPYGLPYDSVIEYMFYNKKSFIKAGIIDKHGKAKFPKNPNEWIAAVKKIHNPPFLYGTGIQGKRHLSNVCEFLPILWAFDAELYDDNFKMKLNTKAALKALTFYKELSKYSPPGSTDWTWDEVTLGLKNNVIGMSMLWDERYGEMEDVTSKVVGNMRYGTVPSISGKPISHYGGSSLFIAASSTKKEAAYLFSQWATSYPVQLLGVGKGSSPTRKSIYRITELRKKYPSFIATDAAAPTTGMRPRIPEWDEMVEIIAKEVNLVLKDKITPKEALKIMNKKINDVLKKAGYK